MKFLKTIASQKRLQILKLLEESGEDLRLSSIASKLNIPPPTVKDHLDNLIKNKLVKGEKFFSISPIWKTVKKFLLPLQLIANSFDFLSEVELHDLPFQFLARLPELEPVRIIDTSTFIIEIMKYFQDNPERLISLNMKIMGDFDLDFYPIAGKQIGTTIKPSPHKFNYKLISSLKNFERGEIKPKEFIKEFPYLVSLNDFRILNAFPLHLISIHCIGGIFFNRKGQIDINHGWMITHERGIKWLTDVFDYYWKLGTPLPNNF
ncbi:MAG: ArsR family transcriptional regulator [Candidatus Helarchaeota archaeon]|nr:ArsR family transcriptional regulator [Candidatus Helarchaeota archaeon]